MVAGGTRIDMIDDGSGSDIGSLDRRSVSDDLVFTMSANGNGFVNDSGGGSTGSEIRSIKALTLNAGEGDDTLFGGTETGREKR